MTPPLSRRDYFAAKAMQGYLASYGSMEDYKNVSEVSRKFADALIAELDKSPPPTPHD